MAPQFDGVGERALPRLLASCTLFESLHVNSTISIIFHDLYNEFTCAGWNACHVDMTLHVCMIQ